MTPGEKVRNYYREQGAKVERERIIKLLESILVEDDNGLKYCYECGNWDDLYPDVATLIKGEQK